MSRVWCAGYQTDCDHGGDCGEERRKYRVPLGEDGRKKRTNKSNIPGQRNYGAGGDGGHCAPCGDSL